ncbi:MAG: FAD-dependent oxidoreductase [Oscillospiraceae bacterium]|nr:FAD-dependent oxidoreductase [Oscillospiraceae bacterium]
MKTVIIGGVAGGASAAARLRRLDEKAEIVLLERGAYISFANCGLPYYVGGTITEQSALTLQTPESFRRRFGIDVRVRSEVLAIDRAARTVAVRSLDAGREYSESYDKLILSTGAEPLVPPIEGADLPGVYTLRTIPDALALRGKVEALGPGRRAVIVGGGYIGVEMAENLVHAGLETTIVEMADHLIAPLDFDMAADVHHYAQNMGLRLRLGTAVTGIRRQGEGLCVATSQGELEADLVLLSVGVRPESRLAREAGLACNARGGIQVDCHMQTSDPDIYAVGDAVETTDFLTGDPAMIPLAGPANRQGRVAADSLCGIGAAYTGTQGSAVLKLFDMTVATTGLNERTARARGIDCDKVFVYAANHAGYYPGSTMLSLKVLFERATGKLLGAQLVGSEGVDKRCDVLATAIRFGATGEDLTRLELCYAPPFGSAKDPVNMAGFMIENLRGGLVKQFHWHDVKDLPRDGSVQLLDVRTPAETARGMIGGFRSIPLDDLRQRLSELDRSKPVYVHCHSGLRSYLACRILTGEGFDCHNLAGGYRLYHAVVGEGTPPERAMPCKK